MLRDNKKEKFEYEFVSIERIVPENHLLRKINKYIDFSFIDGLVKDLYCPDNGRPAIDPKVLFKMLFIGYLYGVRSERQLVKEIDMNIAYRWFLGFTLSDKIPDASTISQNRRRRFKNTDVFQKIFDEIVIQAMKHDLVSGKILYTDSTHIKANANKKRFTVEQVEKEVKDYVGELDKAIDEDRIAHGIEPLKKKNIFLK